MGAPGDEEEDWARRCRRERERRAMAPLQYRAASSLMTAGGVGIKQSRELMFAKHARLESREKLELRGKNGELEKELRQCREREAELEARLRESGASLAAVQEELAVLREAGRVQALANRQMADVLEDERASAFDDQMKKIATDSAAAEALRLMNEYAAAVERKSADLAVAVERSAAAAAEHRERLATAERERREEREGAAAAHEAEKAAMREEHAAEVRRLEEEMEYLGKICTTMQQVLRKQHMQQQQQQHRERAGAQDKGAARAPLDAGEKAGRAAGSTPGAGGGSARGGAGDASTSGRSGDSMVSTPSRGEAGPRGRREGASPTSSVSGGGPAEEATSGGSALSPAPTDATARSGSGRARSAIACGPPPAAEGECGMCSSHLRAMHTLEREAKRLESEVVMLTHDYTAQSHVCRELENASAALVKDIEEVNARNVDLERAVASARAASSVRFTHVITLAFHGFASIAIAYFIFWLVSAGEEDRASAPAAAAVMSCVPETLPLPNGLALAL